MIMQDCYVCDSRPGGCASCQGSGVEPPTKEQLEEMKRDVKRILVVEGGKGDKDDD